MAIKAVWLDVDNTLLDFQLCAKEAMRCAMEQAHIPFQPEMFETFQTINDGLWTDVEQGKITKDDLFRIRWNLIFGALEIDADGIAFEPVFLSILDRTAIPVTGALALIEYLSGKYVLAVASNGPFEQQKNRLELAGMLHYFDYLFISEKIGWSKPHPEFFKTAFAQINSIQPQEMLFLGDSLSADISGGKAAGMKTCWFNFRHLATAEQNPADYMITSLEEARQFL